MDKAEKSSDVLATLDVSIVVPLYNEVENVQPLYDALTAIMGGTGLAYEIVLIDDGSRDGTLEHITKLQERDKHVVVLAMRKNFGQTAAFAAGFDHARGAVIVTMDGDMQNDPADIPKLLEVAREHDLVSGWRKDRKDAFISRLLPSKAANWLISKVTGVALHDYGCSLKAYSRDVVKNLRLYGEMHRFIPAIASWYGVSVAEVVVTHHPRTRGQSKYGISRTIRVFLDLITVKFLQSFSTKPLQLFGPVGLLSGFAGLMISLWLSIDKLVYGNPIGGRPLLLLGVLLIIVGIQLIGMGLLGEMLVRVYHESQRKPIYYLKKPLGHK